MGESDRVRFKGLLMRGVMLLLPGVRLSQLKIQGVLSLFYGKRWTVHKKRGNSHIPKVELS